MSLFEKRVINQFVITVMHNDRLVTYIERDVLLTINNDVILAHFQQMDRRRFSL
jgi:predicted transcriptional regulator